MARVFDVPAEMTKLSRDSDPDGGSCCDSKRWVMHFQEEFEVLEFKIELNCVEQWVSVAVSLVFPGHTAW